MKMGKNTHSMDLGDPLAKSTVNGTAAYLFRDCLFAYWDFPDIGDDVGKYMKDGITLAFTPENFIEAKTICLLLYISTKDETEIGNYPGENFRFLKVNSVDLSQTVAKLKRTNRTS